MFAGFVDADFEAYAPPKWKSNLFNRERLEVKQKILQFARELGASLAAAARECQTTPHTATMAARGFIVAGTRESLQSQRQSLPRGQRHLGLEPDFASALSDGHGRRHRLAGEQRG